MVPVVTTTAADSATLSAADGAVLRDMVTRAGLLGLPSSSASPQPDRPSYRITVEDGGRRSEVALDDAGLPDAVRSLVAWVGSVPGHEESVGPLGRG